MTLDNFKKIVDECRGKTFQIALGGRGDVDRHENFEGILNYCKSNGIVPNFTSSGLGFTKEIISICKKYCGAIAISWYRHEHTLKAINILLEANIKTNIHYVLGNNSIDEAIERLKNNDFPKDINAIIFLLHKPVGLGQKENILTINNPKLKEFFNVIDNYKFNFKIGFDSCTVPALLNFTKNINRDSFDTCEAARWSMYITSDMKALPCSFDQELNWVYDISNSSIKNAWNSKQFENFRNYYKKSCIKCNDQLSCLGGCPIKREVVLCNREEKGLYED
jgi:radical SAM protein with 4Fe4S-binding SPASM domain